MFAKGRGKQEHCTTAGHHGDLHIWRQVRLFRTLNEEALVGLTAQAHRHVYSRREALNASADTHDGLFVVESGCIRFQRIANRGQALTLAMYYAGDTFTFASISRRDGPESVVEALARETVVSYISKTLMRHLMIKYPAVALAALAETQGLLAETYDRLEDMALYPLDTRLAHLLARQAAIRERHVVAATHEELAEMISTTREKVTLGLQHLREAGLVEYLPHHHGITVCDLQRLANW